VPIDRRLVLPQLTALVLVLAGCASSPVADSGTPIAPIGPAHVITESGHEGQTVVWGGRLVGISNLADSTELEIVSLPLDRGDRPRLSAEPGVRFIVRHYGFLEPMQYVPGRHVTVLGEVLGLEERLVGEFIYQQPVLIANQLHLWPADPAQWRSRTNFSVGIGIRL